MKITFIIYDNKSGKRTTLWTWTDVNFIPRKDDMIELSTLGYGDRGKDKYAVVQNVLWKNKYNIEITLGM